MTELIMFHGTGARRLQSISGRGIQPKLGSYVHATTNPIVAAVFAAARADQEDDWGLVVAFRAGEGWETDPQFPESFRRHQGIPPKDIVSCKVIDPSEELEAYEWLVGMATKLGIKIER